MNKVKAYLLAWLNMSQDWAGLSRSCHQSTAHLSLLNHSCFCLSFQNYHYKCNPLLLNSVQLFYIRTSSAASVSQHVTFRCKVLTVSRFVIFFSKNRYDAHFYSQKFVLFPHIFVVKRILPCLKLSPNDSINVVSQRSHWVQDTKQYHTGQSPWNVICAKLHYNCVNGIFVIPHLENSCTWLKLTDWHQVREIMFSGVKRFNV